MKNFRRISYLFAILLVFPMLNAQSGAKEKVSQVQQILNGFDLQKIDSSFMPAIEKQLEQVLLEAKKLRIVANPPYVLPNWQLVDYQNGFWIAKVDGVIQTELRYIPSAYLLKPGHWVGTEVTIQQFMEFCRQKQYPLSRFTSDVRGGGSIHKVSDDGKKFFCEWLIGRSFSKEEEDILIQYQKGDIFTLVVPEIFKNSFYDIGKTPLAIVGWDIWDAEQKALTDAIAFWKSTLNFAVSYEEKNKIGEWLAQLNQRQKMLAVEKKIFEEIAVLNREIQVPLNNLPENITRLDRGVSLCKNYLKELSASQISSHHLKTVESWHERWQTIRIQIEQMGELVKKIEMILDLLQTNLTAEEMRIRTEEALKLMENYQSIIRNHELQSYQNPKIAGWKDDIQKRLEQKIAESQMSSIRSTYQEWKLQQNKESIGTELNALEQFAIAYAQSRSITKGISETDREKYEEWMADAQKRKQLLQEEKFCFSKADQAYTVWNKSGNNETPEQRLKKAEVAIELCLAYQTSLQNRKISDYHQRNVGDYLKSLNNARSLLQLELQIFQQLQRGFEKYMGTPRSTLQEEEKLLEPMVAFLKDYETRMQNREIEGYYQKQVSKYALQLQTRQKLLIEEGRIAQAIESGMHNWKEQQWDNLKSEQYVLNKILEGCREYQNKLAINQISDYYREKIPQWHSTAKERQQKIDEEERLFETIRDIQSQYLKQTAQPDLVNEKNILNKLVPHLETYLAKYEKNEISSYYHKQVKMWSEQNIPQRDRIMGEEALWMKINREYGDWRGKTNWESAENELQSINRALYACEEYQNKSSRREISSYYRQNMSEYYTLLKQREPKVSRERDWFVKIQTKWNELTAGKLQSAEEEQKTMQVVSDWCQEYLKDMETDKITRYHHTQIRMWTQEINKKLQQLQEVVAVVGEIKANYEKWEMIEDRWPGFEEEEQALQQVLGKIREYQTKTNKPPEEQIKIWLTKLEARTQQMQGEKELFEKIKQQEKEATESFADGAQEKKKLEEIFDLGEQHATKSRNKEISNHYQRVIRQGQRKLKDRISKIEREDSEFKAVKTAYDAWKNNSWENNSAEEIRALNAVLAKIQNYLESLQRKRISSYQEKTVKKYEQEVKERKSQLRG